MSLKVTTRMPKVEGDQRKLVISFPGPLARLLCLFLYFCLNDWFQIDPVADFYLDTVSKRREDASTQAHFPPSVVVRQQVHQRLIRPPDWRL